nr:ClpXP protease specificity-enhancing factor [Propionivibrio limicola]
MSLPSTKPYMIRAIHEWCCDNGFTPYLVAVADGRARIPREHVRDGQIVLNVSYDATGSLTISNDSISFKARFNGAARDIFVPIGAVVAIYAKENGVGMGFDLEDDVTESNESATSGTDTEHVEPEPTAPAPAGRPKLQRVK